MSVDTFALSGDPYPTRSILFSVWPRPTQETAQPARVFVIGR
jgi:hypothetical protein